MPWKCPSCSQQETNVFYLCAVCGLEWAEPNPECDPVTGLPGSRACPDALLNDDGAPAEGCGNEAQPSYGVCLKCRALTSFA